MFVIITPTYKRAELLKRAILSVQNQSLSEWCMIIVNDSPDDTSYAATEEYIAHDSRIIYLKNEKNEGVNYSRNRALQSAQDQFADSWIIFLDDDDYLDVNSLSAQSQLIADYPNYKWFVTNRVGSTQISPDYSAHTYTWEWLLSKKLKGDATHCILFKEVADIRFSKTVRQAEEWFYFYQISLRYSTKGKNFLYHDVNTTLSDGYTTEGLNFRIRSKEERKKDLQSLQTEGQNIGVRKFGFNLYMMMRKIKLLIGR